MRRLFGVLSIILGIIAAACVMEVVLRAVEENSYNSIVNDAASGLLIYRPNTTFVHSEPCYDNTVEVNSVGLHAPPVPTEKNADIFRIVVVGSSFVEAIQVPIAEMSTTLLQNELNAQPGRRYTYQVVPIGFSGNGTLLDIFYYERFGALLKPDLVIDLTTENELERNAPGVKPAPQFDAQGNLILTLSKPATAWDMFVLSGKNVLRESQLAVNLFNRYLLVKQNAKDDLASAAVFPGTAQAAPAASSGDAALWSVEGKLLPAFAGLVIHEGGHFMVASWVTPQASSSTAETLKPHLALIAGTSDFSYVDLTSSILQQSTAEGKSPTWACDAHWNADGNRYAAQALFKYLQAHPALIGS